MTPKLQAKIKPQLLLYHFKEDIHILFLPIQYSKLMF